MDLKTAIALGTPHFSAKGKPDICCNCCHRVSFVVLDQARQLLLTVIWFTTWVQAPAASRIFFRVFRSNVCRHTGYRRHPHMLCPSHSALQERIALVTRTAVAA